MIRTIVLLIIPQILLQIVIIAVPALRYTQQTIYYEYYGITFGQEVCQSSSSTAIGSSWQLYVSILFTLLPYTCAYLLNIRTKAELDQLPDIIDERDSLKVSFQIFLQILMVAAPVIGLTLYAPSARTYATICSVLGLPLALCYHIAYVKLATTNPSNISQQRRTSKSASIISTSGDSNEGGSSRSSAAFAVKMAEMYSKIGRTEETVQLVEETLSVWKGSRSTGVTGISNSDGREEVGSGFTKKDLKALEPEELQLIIQLLRIKGNSLIKLHGGPGFAMSAKINIGKFCLSFV